MGKAGLLEAPYGLEHTMPVGALRENCQSSLPQLCFRDKHLTGVNLSTLQLQTPSLPAQRPTQLPLMGNQPNIAANTPVVHIKEEQQAQ